MLRLDALIPPSLTEFYAWPEISIGNLETFISVAVCQKDSAFKDLAIGQKAQILAYDTLID